MRYAFCEIDLVLGDIWIGVCLVPVSPTLEEAIMYLDCEILAKYISMN